MQGKYYELGQIRDGGRCVFCGRDLLTDFDTFWGFLDNEHLIPKSKGGLSTVDNHATACGSCNNLKGNFVPLGYETMTREQIIAACRAHIAPKRTSGFPFI